MVSVTVSARYSFIIVSSLFMGSEKEITARGKEKLRLLSVSHSFSFHCLSSFDEKLMNDR